MEYLDFVVLEISFKQGEVICLSQNRFYAIVDIYRKRTVMKFGE